MKQKSRPRETPSNGSPGEVIQQPPAGKSINCDVGHHIEMGNHQFGPSMLALRHGLAEKAPD